MPEKRHSSRSYWLETYGCQMNKAESTFLEKELGNSGWIPASQNLEADIVIINTCSVRTTAEQRVFGRLGYYKSLKKTKPFKLAVMGCMAERLKEQLLEIEPSIDYIVGTFQKGSFVRFLSQGLSGHDTLQSVEQFEFPLRYTKGSPFQAFVPIMHGCDNFCSYCIVPHVRGREVSRDYGAVMDEIEELSMKGVKEVTLLGQNVNSYRYTKNGETVTFPTLLNRILERTGQIPWIRFLTSHPKDFSDELIYLIGDHEALGNHIHLPVQHGSTKILELMNRKYTREHYLELVSRIKEHIPEVAITTDILIGFPGETEKDLEMTLDLMKKVNFQDAFTYYFNPIEGTEAYEMEDTIPRDEKVKRLSKIIELQHTITREVNSSRIGSRETVLVEAISKKNCAEVLGRTARNEMIVFPGDSSDIGTFVKVKLESYSGNTFKARREHESG